MSTLKTENGIKDRINQCENNKIHFKNEIEEMMKKHKILNHSFAKGERYFLKHTTGTYANIIIVLSLLVVTLLKDINKIEINYKHILILIVSTAIVIILGIAFKYEVVEFNKRKLKYNYYQFQIQLLIEEILIYQDLLQSNNNTDDLETKLKSEYHIQIKNNENSKEIINFIMKLNGINKKKAKILYQQNIVSEDRFNYFQADVIKEELIKMDIVSKILHVQ